MAVTTHPTGPILRPAAVPDDVAPPEPAESIVAAANAAEGFGLTDAQVSQLAAHRNLLLEWNQRFNLTGISDPAEVDRRLVLDALRLLPALDRAGAGVGEPRLIDVGSGAGFPGLVLKIARPDIAVTLVDATGKKVRFLEAAANQLGLAGVTAVHGRAEELGRDRQHRERYDVATARAVAPLPILLEYVVPFVRVGGTALLPKGTDLDAELASGQAAARLLNARIVSAALLPGGQSRLVTVEKPQPTSPTYPRRTGLPSQEPLGTPGAAPARSGGRPTRPAHAERAASGSDR